MSGPAADPHLSDRDLAVSVVATELGSIAHASCVTLHGQGVLIVGPSGSGKSSLALHLMALGAELVSDDQTILVRDGDSIKAAAPPAISGMIEARGVGLLRADVAETAALRLVIDLGKTEHDRLPSPRMATVLGISLRLFHKSDSAAFPAAILQYLKAGRVHVP